MRAVIQRVLSASVFVDGQEYSSIGPGLCCLIGIEKADTQDDLGYLRRKICSLRIFDDETGLMNLDVEQTGGDILLISQFTLHGDARKGRRPSYSKAEDPLKAEGLLSELVEGMRSQCSGKVKTGKFQAMMDVHIVNHGPVTILLDSRKRF
ncbi:MAG TPA: D-tyrosyl-tRNA(Tyr) deacylase [Deltaproteobacteria bacterium]|nr:D-tyrosyl-tRNA(Tyr) deacylase [Deltaproteobacteria bacterium]